MAKHIKSKSLFKPLFLAFSVSTAITSVAHTIIEVFKSQFRHQKLHELIEKLNLLTDVKASHVKDKVFDGQVYLLIENVTENHQYSSIAETLHIFISNKQVIESKNDSRFLVALPTFYFAPVSMTNQSVLVIMRNSDPQMVRQLIMKDEQHYDYNMNIITAEFHTTTQICRVDNPNKCDTYGVNQYPTSKYFGITKPRNETYYPIKYASPQSAEYVSLIIDPGKFHGSMPDKAINRITYKLTHKQFLQVKDFINNHIQVSVTAFTNHKPSIDDIHHLPYVHDYIKSFLVFLYMRWYGSEHAYSFIGFGGDNCNTITQKIFESSGYKGHYFDGVKFDELYLKDKGIAFNILFNQVANAKYMYPISFIKNIFNLYSHLSQPSEENILPLLNAVSNGNSNEAMELVNTADISLLCERDSKGYGIMHYIAAMDKADALKISFIELAIKKGAKVNEADYLDYKTPALICVENNDVPCLEALYKADPNVVSFVNHNQDNLLHIAMMNSAYEAAMYLYKLAPSLAYHDNLEHDLPVCTLVQKGLITLENFDDKVCKTADQLLCRYMEPVFGDSLALN